MDDAHRYRVRLLGRDYETVFEARVDTPSVELPAALRARDDLRWELDALARDGATLRHGAGQVPAQ